MNASMPFSLDHDRSMEDQILLKSALAVVVLRRRALGKARQVRFSGKGPALHDFTRQSEDKTNESDGTEQAADQTTNEEHSFHCQSEKSTQELTLFRHHPILTQCRPRGESDQLSLDSCPSGITERSSTFSVSHVESMANLVIPTTIPLYAMYGSHSTVRDDSSTTTVTAEKETLASPIYDYQNANSPSFHDFDRTKSNKSKIATYGVLDGLLLHLTSQSSFHNRIYSMIMIPVILPILLGQSGDTLEEKKIMSKILSLCTVLHRFVLLDPTCFEEVMVGICRTLKMLYRHRLDTECVQYRINRCSNVSSATVGIDFNHDTTVKMLDVLAVNMIVLLENIMILHLKHYGRKTSSTSSLSAPHDGKNGMIGFEYVMKILHQELEQLLVPIRIEEMAAFYVRDGQRIHLENLNEKCMDDETHSKAMMCNGLNTGGKLMLRLSLYDIIRKMC